MESEDIYTFFREQIDAEFAMVWTKAIENRDECDVRLECSDGQYCHSHQSLLSISSQCFSHAIHYFHMNRDLPSNEELVIDLPFVVPFDVLVSIIQYINNGFVSIPESRVLKFLEISRFLAIRGLKDIQLVFLNEIDNFNENLVINQLNSMKNECKYVLELKDSEDMINSSEDSYDMNHSSVDSLYSYGNYRDFTSIKGFSFNPFAKNRKNLLKKAKNLVKKSALVSTTRRAGIQGRRPQIGSPLITEEFRSGDRYQCKVCFRSYLWKKSLVRHYRDLHPDNIQLVTE